MNLQLRLFLRSLAATPFRLMLIDAGIIGLSSIDVRPLPLWTIDAAAYLLHFVATYLLAWWVMRGRVRTWKDGAVVALTFLFVGTLLEVLLAILLSGPSPLIVSQLMAPKSLILYVVYVIAAMLAFLQARPRSEEEERLSLDQPHQGQG